MVMDSSESILRFIKAPMKKIAAKFMSFEVVVLLPSIAIFSMSELFSPMA
jgi:hypothetical protein